MIKTELCPTCKKDYCICDIDRELNKMNNHKHCIFCGNMIPGYHADFESGVCQNCFKEHVVRNKGKI